MKRVVFFVKIRNTKTLIRFVIIQEITEAINVLPLLKPEKSICGYWDGAIASHIQLSHRIHLPGERDEWFDQKQLPPAICTKATSKRAIGICSVTVCQTVLLVSTIGTSVSEYAHSTANNSVTNRRAKALCLHEGNPTLPCGKIYLEDPNVPEVTKWGFEHHSTWLFAYESCTRRFANLLTVPVGTSQTDFEWLYCLPTQ